MHSNLIIQDYQPVFHNAFRQLNLKWLNAYQLLDDHDVQVLDNPEALILKRGGFIYLATDEEAVIGSAALIRNNDKEYELGKMSVAEPYRGRGIGKFLLEHCLAKARSLQAEKIILFSNHQLKPALSLYAKYGFRHVPVKDSPFETADVRMECIL